MIGLRSPGRGGLLIMLLAAMMVCSAGFAQPFENCPNPKGGSCFDATPGIPVPVRPPGGSVISRS